jgi:hypothetical protein
MLQVSRCNRGWTEAFCHMESIPVSQFGDFLDAFGQDSRSDTTLIEFWGLAADGVG